jgi:ectoine hydroxylase-related dioxygenase (phytanoyl-CoA dioxygenase family)
MSGYVTQTMRDAFWNEGVVLLPGVLDRTWMDLVALGIDRNLRSPGPFAVHHYEGTPRAFFDDYCNYAAVPEYQMLLRDSPIVDVVADLLGTENLWQFYEQIFIKQASEVVAKRTPWHQDTTYWITGGTQLAGFWITLDPTLAAESLEFVRGSHKGPTYAGTAFDPNDETTRFQPDQDMPTLPDIEADRTAWNILSFDTKPGDVVMFHPGMLHGGGAAIGGSPRRTLSVRFFGDDVTYQERSIPAPSYPGISARLSPGDPLRGSWFPQLYPRPTGPLW